MPAHLIAETGPFPGLILNLQEGEEWIVGRDPTEASFVIDDQAVSRSHARLTRSPEGIYLENLSHVNPALVNGEQHDGPILLREGDRIQIGTSIFLFSEEDNLQHETPAKSEQEGGYDEIFNALEEPDEDLELLKPKRSKEDTDSSRLSSSNPYDTIFEDTTEETQVPFSLLSDTPFLLKVISGPNAGAEIGIEKGKTYTIGKDPASCDIVFQDLSVSRHHARLEVAADGTVQIEDLRSKNGTLINGAQVTEKTAVAPQDLISLGTTIFLIIDREAQQETLYSPIPMPREEPKKEAEKIEEVAPQQEAKVEEQKDWKKEPIPLKYFVLAGSIVAMALIIFLSVFSLFKAKEVEIVRKEPVDIIQKTLAKFPGVAFSFNPASGKLFLMGHLLTSVHAQEMLFQIGELDCVVSVENNVVIDEYVSRMMNDVLAGNPNFRGVSIQSPQAGNFLAVGFVDTVASAAQLSENLIANFPYFDKLDNEVVIGEALNAQLQGLFLSKGFGAVSFQYSNGSVILSGNYSDTKQGDFQEIISQIKVLRGVYAVQNFAVPSDPNLAAIDISQQIALSGIAQYDGQGYSAILNGKIYTLGDAISGMKITEINSTMILLEKDGIKYRIGYMQ